MMDSSSIGGDTPATSPSAPAIDQQVVWVYTDELDATARFYREVLGLEQVLDQGACRIHRAGPSSFIGVCRTRPERRCEPNGVVITLVTPDVDAWYARLEARGVVLEAPPAHSPAFNVYSFFARDPNGYRLEFQRFLDPAWPRGEARGSPPGRA